MTNTCFLFSNKRPPNIFVLFTCSEHLIGNTRIYNLSSGPHITCFSEFVAKKRKNFE